MNIFSSKISPVSALIRGALGSVRADYNNITVRTGASRVFAKRVPHTKKWPGFRHRFKNGKEYYGFTYYPNSPNEIDPEWQPTELFMIRLRPRKGFSGIPYWEKKLLKYYHLDRERSAIAIVTNDEETNKMLWQIKHLIEIIPITFPDGYPEDGDISKCRLYENGEFRISKSLEPSTESFEATEKFQKNPELPTKHVVETHARRRWIFPVADNNVHI